MRSFMVSDALQAALPQGKYCNVLNFLPKARGTPKHKTPTEHRSSLSPSTYRETFKREHSSGGSSSRYPNRGGGSPPYDSEKVPVLPPALLHRQRSAPELLSSPRPAGVERCRT